MRVRNSVRLQNKETCMHSQKSCTRTEEEFLRIHMPTNCPNSVVDHMSCITLTKGAQRIVRDRVINKRVVKQELTYCTRVHASPSFGLAVTLLFIPAVSATKNKS